MVRPVDPRSWKPKYVQVAEGLREQITAGKYRADGYLPSEADLAHEYDVNTRTARRALAVLENERLIVREQGVRARVRPQEERTIVYLRPGDKAITRPASPDERRHLRLGEREPVAETTRADGTVETAPAYEIEFVAEAAPDGED